MLFRGPAHEWSTRLRFAAAALTGLVWTLLFFGLDRFAAPPLVFWGLSIVLFAPVLAVLARDIVDLGLLIVTAYVVSVVAALATAAPPLAQAPRLVMLATFAWIGSWLATILLFALRARSGGLRTA